MIYLNVAFLVIRPSLNTIVKILINASQLIINNRLSMHVLLQYGSWNAQRAL